jgi:hypothetical protein
VKVQKDGAMMPQDVVKVQAAAEWWKEVVGWVPTQAREMEVFLSGCGTLVY